MKTLNYEGFYVDNGNSKKVIDALVVEAALQININNEPFTVIMRTPGDDNELIRGVLYAEDIYRAKKLPVMETVESKSNGFSIINVTIPKKYIGNGYINKRTLLSVSSCGICGKLQLEDVYIKGQKLATSTNFDLKQISSMFFQMEKQQQTFELSGGSHAAGIFDKNYQLLTLKEDIGRHNAVDKAIGMLLSQSKLHKSGCMLVSGRVSYEIISKAFVAKIPVVVAISACSSLAVDFAKEFGICLIGFSRGSKATLYSK